MVREVGSAVAEGLGVTGRAGAVPVPVAGGDDGIVEPGAVRANVLRGCARSRDARSLS